MEDRIVEEDIKDIKRKENITEKEVGVGLEKDIWTIIIINFKNRLIPIYPEKEIVLKPNEQKAVKVKVPFIDEISGMAIIKILDGDTYSMLLIKLKFKCNKAILAVVNNGKDTTILRPEEMI